MRVSASHRKSVSEALMKKLGFLFVMALGFAWNCHAQTWTYVQDSTITYCSSGTSCSNFSGTMIPTLAGTVWVFYIDTVSASSASVSGGGVTWTQCSQCGLSVTNHHAFVFYAIGGSAGQTNFSVSAPGNSGSLSVQFFELQPPSGATASFDTGGNVSSTTCSGTCTGVSLSLSSTDAVIQFLDGNAPPSWNGWSSPYYTLASGDGVHLNAAAGTEAAPTVTVRPGSTGAVFSAIAFKSSLGTFTAPARGPLSLVSFADPDPAHGLNGLNCAPTCSLTLSTATGAAHLLYLEAANTSGVFLGSVSGGGTWVVPASCQIKGGQSSGNALSCAYVLSSSSTSVTAINITMAGNANTNFAFYEVATTTGSFAFDTSANATNAASFNPSGVSLTLASGETDVVFQSISVFGGTSSVSYYPFVRGCSSGCGPQFWNGQAASNAILNVSGTAPTPQWANQQDNSTVVSGVAFKVGSGTAQAPNPPSGLTTVVN